MPLMPQASGAVVFGARVADREVGLGADVGGDHQPARSGCGQVGVEGLRREPAPYQRVALEQDGGHRGGRRRHHRQGEGALPGRQQVQRGARQGGHRGFGGLPAGHRHRG